MRPLPLPALAATALVALASLTAAEPPANPLLRPSPLPYGLPDFAALRPEHFRPAFEAALTERAQELAAIAQDPAAPTFDNTIVALERAGGTLYRVRTTFEILTSGFTAPELEALDAEMAPRLAAAEDALYLDAALFRRVRALFDRRATLGLDDESLRLLERYHRDFVRAGANLAPADQERLRGYNGELARLAITFKQNLLKETNAASVLVDTREELAGLDEAAINAAAKAAAAAGQPGKYLLRLVNTTGQPPLANLRNRALRERLHTASLNRGSHGGPYDNRTVVTTVARLRAERARLLGYPTHADYQLEIQTAKSVDAVNTLLRQLAGPSLASARRQAAEMQALVDASSDRHELAAWDWDFHAEQLRQAKYAFNGEDVRPYYEAGRVLEDGIFYAATRFYGLRFERRPELKGYSPDMTVYEVFNEDGSPLALFLCDLYARPNKRGGAWMNAYVRQNGLTGAKPVVAIHLNVPKPPEGEPTLLTQDEVRTYFHEFGHALHGMFSATRYPSFAGTKVPRDFVEFPSQVNEMWARWPEVLQHYARHYRTGEPIPATLLEKMAVARKFNEGFRTTELVAANVVDQAWHQLAPEAVPAPDQVAAFEAAALRRAGVDYAPIPPRYRSTYYSHIFSNDYSAGYYSYFWSEVLDADVVEWISAHGGLTRANGDRLRDLILSRGGSRDALGMFRAFTGADPDLRPLLVRRGLDAAEK